jgi:Holliday junction resolvase
VIAAKDGVVYVIELKYRAPDTYAYFDSEKIEGLIEIAEDFGGKPRLCTRWKRDTTFYAYQPWKCYQTDGGNFRLSADERDDADLTLPPSA